jgi:hypothetical protein
MGGVLGWSADGGLAAQPPKAGSISKLNIKADNSFYVLEINDVLVRVNPMNLQ